MPKIKSSSMFVCSECGATSPQWIGKCPSCNKFNTYIEEITTPQQPQNNFNNTNFQKPLPLSKITFEKFNRLKSGIDEFDTVLGGGIVPGSLILIGGDPGIGKSTLLTQTAAYLSNNGNKVLYASAEESCSQVKLRTKRLGLDSDNLYIINETCLNNIECVVDDYDIVIIDSIQAVYLSEMNSAAGSVGQVRECAARLMRIAKSKNITFFIVGHVTKEGSIAGPKVLEHIMDTVLYFEGETENNYKLLRAVKNRFGSAMEVGVFEMTGKGIFGVKDYSGIFISESHGNSAGSIITPSISGNRCMPVEIQTLLAKTIFGMPRRMPLGIDYNKLVVMLAVLEKRCGIPFYTNDVYINAMGGIKLNEPSVDLAIILALAGAYKGQASDKYTAVFGEVGLTGEIRPVNYAEKRIQECIKLGVKSIIFPAKNMKGLEQYKDKIELIPLNYCSKAIDVMFK